MTQQLPYKAIDERIFREAVAFLSKRDPVMAKLIVKYSDRPFPYPVGVISALLRAVVAQQISNRAAATLWKKLQVFLGKDSSLWCQRLSESSIESIRALGINERKAMTLKTVSEKFLMGEWSEVGFATMDDESVSKTLRSIKGIGPWTASAVLIFGLGRCDVLPLTDYGIRVALAQLYLDDKTAVSEGLQRLKTRVKSIECTWEPYRTVAAWYLWCSLENSP